MAHSSGVTARTAYTDDVGKDGAVAKNTGVGRRIGAVSGRSQFILPSGHPAKRDANTGKILSIKSDKILYKGIRKEKGKGS